MTPALTRDLEPLTHSGMELADPAMDLRGREIHDRAGETVGTVEDLLIDPALRVPRMFVLETSGGLLGLGKKHHLVPLEAISGGDPRTVKLDRTKDEILGSPEYTPSEGDEEEAHYGEVYGWYRIAAYWAQEGEQRPGEMGQHSSSTDEDRQGST